MIFLNIKCGSREYIRNNQYIYNFLREESNYYKLLYRDKNNIKKIESLAKEKYKLRKIDKIERISKSIDLINSFVDVLK